MIPSANRKVYEGIADRRQMFRMFDRHAQRPNRWEGDDSALPMIVGKNEEALTQGFFETIQNSPNTAPATTPGPGAKGGLIIVTAPDGSKHTFANQAAADFFKQSAGIK